MRYLYGDSTQSDLTTNFLEQLRDALDFAVFVLQADEKIKAGAAKAAALSEEMAAEIGRIEQFTAEVGRAIDGAQKGPDGSPTAMCAARVKELLSGASRQASDAVRAKLASDIGATDAEDAALREACHVALAEFLGPHGTSDPDATERVALLDTGRYDATLLGSSSFGVEWMFALAIPDGNLWASPVRIERISPQLELKVPQVTGWLSKEVKVRPQRIEKHAVTELTRHGGKTTYKLRIEAAAETGFDVEVDTATKTVKMARIGPADDAAAGAFDLDAVDVPVILDLTATLTTAVGDFTRAKLEVANVGGAAEFRAVPVFTPIVEQLIATLAPIVREIARRSLTPTELVLRRALADDRREEVFVTKATLREKYAGLNPPLRALFASLGLDGPPPTPAPGPVAAATPPPRAELGRSQPPPPMPPSPPTMTATPTRPDIRRSQPPGPLPPVSTPPPRPPPLPPTSSPADSSGKNEAFVEAVKKIMLVLKSGNTDEGYTQYADLLSSNAFADYAANDQRQALKLLLLAKAPPTRSEAVLRAYKIALARIQSLVDKHAEPADYEMLGVAHVQLDDKSAATAAFDIALKLERARNPASELSASLARRMTQLA